MAITLDDLTVNFGHLKREAVLEDWHWLIGRAKQPILLTALGDAFLQEPEDNTVHFLDAGSGELSEVVDSFEEFQALLRDNEFVTNFFLPGLIVNLRKAGKTLQPGEIYSYTHPPVLGGECAVENFEPANIEVHFSITGQLCEQVANLPEGTPISEIKIVER
jgi:hypothetical protein